MAILMEAGCCCWTGFMLVFSFCHLHSLPGSLFLPFHFSHVCHLKSKVAHSEGVHAHRTFLAVSGIQWCCPDRRMLHSMFSQPNEYEQPTHRRRRMGHWNIAFYISNAPSHSSLLHAFLTFKFDNIVSQVWCLMLANNNNNQTWIDIKIDTRTHTHHIGPKRKAIRKWRRGKEMRTRVVEEFRNTEKENGKEYENNQTSQNVC